MDYQHLLFEQNEGVCTLTLHRPEVYNAINNRLADELMHAFQTIEQIPEVRVVVLTGSGRAFCTGHDLKAPENQEGRPSSYTINRNYVPLILAMRYLPKPILCRLNGVAAGAGCSLALACDMIIADEEAELMQVFVNIGLVPDAGSAYFLPQMVSRNQAFELMSKATRLKAREALALGIVNRAVPASELDAALKIETDYYTQAPTKAIGMIKKMVNQAYHADLRQMMELEAVYQDHAHYSHDHREGVQAFLEKRRPRFKGH
ncbi:MAG: enoyl-CoA hydratase-related protein [Microscillaceae bacterium]